MRVEDNSHQFELVLTDTKVDKDGNVTVKKRSKTFKDGNDMYAWAQAERPTWKFELKQPIKSDKKKKKKS